MVSGSETRREDDDGRSRPGRGRPAERGDSRSAAAVPEDAARKSLDVLGEPLREHFGQPVQRVTELTRRTLALFPVRVWRHFLASNGFLLAAGMSYQAIFAIFAAVYVGFSVTGIWLVSHPDTLDALVQLINTYVPSLIGPDGAVGTDEIQALTATSATVLGWTGVFALAGLVWTAIGWIDYSRISVRSIFGLEKDTRAYVLLKTRDLLAAIAFGAILLVSAALSVASTAALDWIFGLLDISDDTLGFNIAVSASGLLLVLVINTGALAAMFRFLSGAAVEWRRIWGGSLFGGLALGVLQVLGSTLIGSASKNPLLATFAVFIGLLLWFRLTGIVTLVAAAWIAVSAGDRGESLRRVTPKQLAAERRTEERKALQIAAEVGLREAQTEYDDARWYNRFVASRRLRKARERLTELNDGAST
ncbi:YihY/virulence factor BrkB family protein [Luethyella okanaganae]|uniref:YihY/virulence factor BrkB family protein n=1 Tax=Luethyella okanaganae TaxID=69372 RepID=A0ABW1VD32_9MICO